MIRTGEVIRHSLGGLTAVYIRPSSIIRPAQYDWIIYYDRFRRINVTRGWRTDLEVMQHERNLVLYCYAAAYIRSAT